MDRKVTTGFACINEDSDNETECEEDAPIFVTHLKKVVNLYNKGMEYLADGESKRALEVFNEVLNYPQSLEVRQSSPPEGDPLHALSNVCQVALKWKAELLLENNQSPLEAFECYKEAFKMHPNDIVLCKKLGTLAMEVGYIGFARCTLEEGWIQRPDYTPLLEPLMEVCLEVQDYEAAHAYGKEILKGIPHHRRAKELVPVLEEGKELPEILIHYRVDHEPIPHNNVRRFIPSFSWSDLIKTVIEIIDASNMEDEQNGENGILIWSVNNDWSMLSQAKLKYQICQEASSVLMEIDPREKETNSVDQVPVEEAKSSRFPLRSRISQQKSEEGKAWDILAGFKTAIGAEKWELLLKASNLDKSAEPKSIPLVSEDPTGICCFLSEKIVSDLVSPVDLAVALLEWKSKRAGSLEEKEADLLCSLDKIVGFNSTPFYDLFMAELLLDQALVSNSTGILDSDSMKLHREDRALQRSQKHIFKCIECKAVSQMESTSSLFEEFLEDNYLVRMYWTLGRIQLLEGRCQEAEKAFHEAMEHASCLAESVVLEHVLQDRIISSETIQIKLVMCLYQDIIEGLEVEEDMKDQYQDICNLLIPVLFVSKLQTKPSILLSPWRYKGLLYLSEAAKEANDVDTEFLCHLHLLDLVLESNNYLDVEITKDRSSVKAQIPTGLNNSIQCLPKREAFLQILKFVTFIYEKWSEGALTVHQTKLFPLLEKQDCHQLIRKLTLKSVQHLEWCFWRFFIGKGDKQGSSGKTESRKRALHEAAAFLFVCVQLDPVFGKHAELMENLAFFLYDILNERQAICLKKKAGIRNITFHLLSNSFAAWIDFFSSAEDLEMEALEPAEKELLEINVEEEADIKHSIEALIDGVSHFLKCLFDLELVSSGDSAWLKKTIPSTGSKDSLKPQALKTVWRYLSPCLAYLESKEGDLHVFGKITGLVYQVINVLTPPPSSLLDSLSIDSIFNSEDPAIDQKLANNELPAVLGSNIEKVETMIDAVDHKEIHEEIYYYYALSLLDMDLEFGQNEESILGSRGLQVFEDQIKWIKMDLVFNVDRYWSWECLAINYKEATEMLMSSLARDFLPGEIEQETQHCERLEYLIRCQRRCFQIAKVLAKGEEFKDERRYVLEMLAELDLFRTPHCPPFFYPTIDQSSPQQLTSTKKEALLSAKTYFQDLLADQYEKWETYYHLGKIAWKLREGDWEKESLELFAKSHGVAQQEEGGLIDPFYKLHSTRLKLLVMGCNRWELLMEHRFQSEMSLQTDNEQNQIFTDCKSALEFCSLKVNSYHRVQYRLAQSFAAQGNYIGALSYLQQLFIKGKKKFCFAFFPIDPRQCRVSQKGSSSQSSARLQGNPSSSIVVKISGCGIGESIWKFAASVRKYLTLYLRLLYLTKDIELLTTVGTILMKGDMESPKELQTEIASRCQHPCFADMPLRAFGIRLMSLHAGLRSEMTVMIAMQLDASMNRVLSIVYCGCVSDSEYSQLAHGINQLLLGTWELMQGISDFDTFLFSAIMEVFYEERCNLESNKSVEALKVVLPDYDQDGNTPNAVLTELAFYAMIYPVLVLRSRDIGLASRLASATQQKVSFLKDHAIGKKLINRNLFCIVQVLFYNAEEIRSESQTKQRPVVESDSAVMSMICHVSHLIRHFHEGLMDSRFLALRMMHIMQYLYEALCVVNKVEIGFAMQTTLSLKTILQLWMNAIQKVRSTPQQESVCIDLTGEEETQKEHPEPDISIKVDNQIVQMIDVEMHGEEKPSAEVPVDQSKPVSEDQNPTKDDGVFANAFQQFIRFNDDEPDEL